MVNDKLYSINQIYELFEIENFNLRYHTFLTLLLLIHKPPITNLILMT